MIRTALLLAVTSFAGVAFACEGGTGCKMTSMANAEEAAQGEIPAGATVATFTVGGLDCGGCAKSVRSELEAIDGVKVAIVQMDKGTVQVAYDTAKTNTEALQKAIAHGGKYEAKLQS